MATRVLIDSVARTGARPPQIVRLPRRGPLSRFKGATPTRAASRWRFNVPNSGRSSRRVRAQTGPIPGTLRSSSSRSRHTGLARSVVSRSSSSAASRVLSQVIWAWMSVWSRGGALPRRFCSAVRMATSGRRRASRARSSSAWASGKGRGWAIPPRQNGLRPVHRGHPSWPAARWLWRSPGLGGD
jgi:hypothetical protein